MGDTKCRVKAKETILLHLSFHPTVWKHELSEPQAKWCPCLLVSFVCSERGLFSVTLKNIVGNKKFFFFLAYFQSHFSILHFNLASWLPLLNYTKEMFIECPLCAKHRSKDRDWWCGGRQRGDKCLHWDGWGVFISAWSSGCHFFLSLPCSRLVLSNWNIVGVASAGHKCRPRVLF